MDFASSARAVANRSGWKGIVAKSSVMPQRPCNIIRQKSRLKPVSACQPDQSLLFSHISFLGPYKSKKKTDQSARLRRRH